MNKTPLQHDVLNSKIIKYHSENIISKHCHVEEFLRRSRIEPNIIPTEFSPLEDFQVSSHAHFLKYSEVNK
jgi:hypothetical protein